jgi:hypothetical protein
LNQFGSKFIFIIFGFVEIAAELTILYIFLGLIFFIPLGIILIITAVTFALGNSIIK